MPFGRAGTLILSFIDDTTRARAVDWMGKHLDLQAELPTGYRLGEFQNLPMVAVPLKQVRPELVQTLKAGLGHLGLVSIYPDQPLTYFLNDSVPFIGADAARAAFNLSGRGVGVAVIDTGIDATHPDLVMGQNVGRNVKIVGPITGTGVPVGGYLYVDAQNTDLTSGHGTHVASTIAGTGAASTPRGKYTGVAPGATLVGVGAGDVLFVLYALQAYDFVLRPEVRERFNVRVINNSWGTSGRFSRNHPIALATKRAYDAGIMVVFAAGNAGPGQDTLNPHSVSPCAISVAAGDVRGFLATFSSRGIPGDPLYQPDITAPGVHIVAARSTSGTMLPWSGDPPNAVHYARASGTSMAAPHVAGTLALMLEANPNLSFERALEMIQRTARPMFYQVDGFTVKQREAWEVGAGYLNAFRAVREAVRSNANRFELHTDTLATWQGTVPTSVCAPLQPCVIGRKHEFTLSVPSGYTALHISTSWLNPAADLDLYVYDPRGNLVASSATLNVPEQVSIANPVAGAWRVVMRGYLNPDTTYIGLAEGDRLVRR
jgi:serine protease AprX